MKSTATIRRSAVALVVAVLGVGLAGFTPGLAHALCNPSTCNYGDPVPKPTPPPPTLAVTGISPSFGVPADPVLGLPGDTVTLGGSGLLGASVTVAGVAAPVVGGTSTQLVFTVPPIPMMSGQTVPVVVTRAGASVSTSFTLSWTTTATAAVGFGVNGQLGYGYGSDGSASASASLVRDSGLASTQVTVVNQMWFQSLSVSESAVFLDASGAVIGFTKPQTVTANGTYFAWPSGISIVSQGFTDSSDPSVTKRVRSISVVLSRDSDAELLSTLTNAVNGGLTLAGLLSLL
jgi:hypothetical protein